MLKQTLVLIAKAPQQPEDRQPQASETASENIEFLLVCIAKVRKNTSWTPFAQKKVGKTLVLPSHKLQQQ